MRKKRPRILPFVILTTVTLLTWATLDVWRTFKNPEPVVIDEVYLREFNPSLGEETMSEIKNRTFFTDEEARTSISQKTPAPTPNTAEEEVGSPSGQTP